MRKTNAGTESQDNVPALSLIQVNSLEEARVHIASLIDRIQQLEQYASDHDQRFDTLQTPLWKRVWYKIDGWPWYDLNGTQSYRPWHGLKKKIRGDS